MKKQLRLTASLVLAALTASTAEADDRKPGTIQYGTNVLANNSRIEVKWCEPSKDKCDCPSSLGDKNNPTPAAAAPKASCVQMDIPLGRPRYSALAESVMLQLNELLPTSALYSPNGFKVVAGCAVHSVSRDRNVGGVPKWVQLVSPSGLLSAFTFADGESVAKAMSGLAGRSSERLAMVDAQGWATASDPAFYDFYPGDGARWRFGASRAAPDYLQLAGHQAADGRVETGRDLGLEIIRDADGVLRQVATPGYLADFVVLGPDAYDLSVYPNDASCLSGARTAGGWFGVLDGAVPEVTWKFRNPAPGTCRDLDVTREKAGTEPQTWRYRYVEAVRDFTLTHPGGLKEERLERMASDDGKSWVLRRTESGADGIPFTVKEQHYETGASGDALARTVRDPGGLNLTQRYEYYASGAAAGLEKGSVFEDGSWAGYEYDGAGRLTAEIRPWLDAPTNAPAEQCAVTRYAYAPFAPGDFLRFNDQRPRTEVKEVCGVEVSRTYHAYPTNAVGQAQEIEERAAFPGSPYGHASNPRTVKTFYAPSAAVPLAGRLATVVYPGGKTETFGYEYGTFNAATFAFAADPDGGAWRETVTTSYGENSGVQVLRSSRVWDGKGREVLDESYVEDGEAFALIGWKRMAYDRSGNLTETAYSDGRVESAKWGANCCGKESETSAEGIITVYGYNLLKQKVSETKKGMAADGSEDITTLYAYDLANRVLSAAVTNIASGLGYVASRSAYDAVGRATNDVDRLGNATATEYAANGTVTIRKPNGVVSVTEKYGDGRAKLVGEDGAVRQAHAYGVTPDGQRWTLSANGAFPGVEAVKTVAELRALASALDCPWTLMFRDSVGQPAVSMHPGFGRTVLVASNAYDAVGNLVSTVETSCRPDGTGTELIKSQLYAYADDGSRLFSALDLNTNGVIDVAGPDRIDGSATAYEKAGEDWWHVSRSWVYPEFNSAVAVTTSVERVRLTGLGVQRDDDGVLVSHAEAFDARGNPTVSETLFDRENRKVTLVKVLPTSVQPGIQIAGNGLLLKTVSSTTVTNTFGYDVLGRQTASTDGRGNTTVTAYNPSGLVAYTEVAATNRTTYGYDTIGRRTSVTDALGNITHTQYDAEGRVTKTWGAVHPVEYGYDAQGRMVSMKTFRDENGLGDETRWLYDEPTGLLISKLCANGKGPSYTYTYTSDGRRSSRTWARGVITRYPYDAAEQLVAIEYESASSSTSVIPSVAFNYNRIGQQVSAIGDASINRFSYSPITLDLISETQNGIQVCYVYDSLGRVSNMFLGEDYSVTYRYDDFGHLKSVVARDGAFVSTNNYVYMAGSDLVVGQSAGPLTVSKAYEPNRDRISLVHNASDVGVTSQYNYRSDALGRYTVRSDSRYVSSLFQAETNCFYYNQRGEIVGALMGNNKYDYFYDLMGNRCLSAFNAVTNTYLVNEFNQYIAVSCDQQPIAVLAYDPDGNLLTNGVWSYTWDAENRLISVASNGVSVVNFGYDQKSRRIYKETNGMVVRFYYDDWAMICESSEAESVNSPGGQSVRYYYYGLDLSGTMRNAGTIGGLWLSHSVQGSWFYAYDGNGNVSEIVNDDGDVVGNYEYDPFGRKVSMGGTEATDNPFRFSTKYYVTGVDLYYYGHRYYSPIFGRWMSVDPVEEEGGLNYYLFVMNNGVNYYDFLGLKIPGLPGAIFPPPTAGGYELVTIFPIGEDSTDCNDKCLEGPKRKTCKNKTVSKSVDGRGRVYNNSVKYGRSFVGCNESCPPQIGPYQIPH